MEFVIKKIESEQDKLKTKNLWLSHKKWEGSYLPRTEEEINKIFESKTTDVYGSFDLTENLLSTMTLTTWTKIPCYTFNGHCIAKDVMKIYNFKKPNPVTPLVNALVTMMEKNNYFTWYYTQAITPGLCWQFRNSRDILRNTEAGWDSVKNQHRYDRYFEEIIPPHSTSKYGAFGEMIDNKDYNHSIGIVKLSLKPEYRPWPDAFDNGDKYFVNKIGDKSCQ